MKSFFKIIIAIVIITGCKTRRPIQEDHAVIDSPSLIKNVPNTDTLITNEKMKPFKKIIGFTAIKDSSTLIKELVTGYLPDLDYERVKNYPAAITWYKKLKMAGTNKELIFLEYDYGEGSSAEYPWKYQLLFDLEGNHIKTFSALRFEFLKIFPAQNPFLVILISTARGNGGHEIYKMSSDTLENVYDGYLDYETQTYDVCQDNAVYEPGELKIIVFDDNHDGKNDIAFKGKKVLIQGLTKQGDWYDGSYSIHNPFKKVPIEFVFLYDKKTGHFKAKENYVLKYKEYDH